MIPWRISEPVHLTARDGTRTGLFVLTIEWAREESPQETVTTDHNVSFDSWETVSSWLEDRARTMDDALDEEDIPVAVRSIIQRPGASPPPAVSARELASSIRAEIAERPQLDSRLLATRTAFEERIQQRAAAAAEAERSRVQQQAAVAQIAQAKQVAAARMAPAETS